MHVFIAIAMLTVQGTMTLMAFSSYRLLSMMRSLASMRRLILYPVVGILPSPMRIKLNMSSKS